MSQQYDDTNRGVLFKNDRKDSDKHPDYKGKVNVGGQEFWLSAWIKDGAKGKFMSLSVQPKEDQGQGMTNGRGSPDRQGTPNQRLPAGASFSSALDDDIPFAPEVR